MAELVPHNSNEHAPATPAAARRRFRPRRLLVIALSTYLGVVVLVGLFQSKLIYFPSRALEATPKDAGLPYEDVALVTADGVTISAWYVPRRDARATILFFHGNAGNNGHRVAELKVLHHLGFSTLLVDYRGFGSSGGHPTESGTYLDADAAWTHLTGPRGLSPKSIVIFGESLGGAVAIDLAARVAPGALVVQSTFTSLGDIGSIHYPWLPVRLILRHRYDSAAKIGRVYCPKLFIHSTEDSLVPFKNGRALFDAAPPPKRFLETPGEHNSGGFMYSNEYELQLAAFIRSAVAAD